MKLSEIYHKAKESGKSNICRFMRDMKRANLKMEYYRGRFWWTGPAVVVPNIQDVLSNTKVKCQWDNMGFGYVVYPIEPLDLSKQIFGG